MIAFIVIIVVWVGVLVTIGHYYDAKVMGPVADSLAPIGSLVTALALLFAFKQRHADQRAAHRDKLAAAYVAWFQEAWRIAGEAVGHADEAQEKMSGERPTRYDPPGAVKAIEALHATESKLRIVAAPLLMLERDADLALRAKATYAAFPVFEHPLDSGHVAQYKAMVATLPALARARQKSVDELYWDAVAKLEKSED